MSEGWYPGKLIGEIIWGSRVSRQVARSTGQRKVIAVEEDKETVSGVFARAPYFKVVEDGRVIEVVRNPYREAGGGAGPSAARFVASYHPDVVVAGSIGNLARRELESRGIRVEII